MSVEPHGNPVGNAPLAPVWVGVALLFLPPIGLFLLWKQPTLRTRTMWWKAAYAWTALWTIGQVGNALSAKSRPRRPSPPRGRTRSRPRRSSKGVTGRCVGRPENPSIANSSRRRGKSCGRPGRATDGSEPASRTVHPKDGPTAKRSPCTSDALPGRLSASCDAWRMDSATDSVSFAQARWTAGSSITPFRP